MIIFNNLRELFTIQKKKNDVFMLALVDRSRDIGLLVFFPKYNMYRDTPSVDYIKLLQLSFHLHKLCENFYNLGPPFANKVYLRSCSGMDK